MERLTEKYNGKNIVKSSYITMVFNNELGNRFEGEAIDKLAAYEDSDEKGLPLSDSYRESEVKDGEV